MSKKKKIDRVVIMSSWLYGTVPGIACCKVQFFIFSSEFSKSYTAAAVRNTLNYNLTSRTTRTNWLTLFRENDLVNKCPDTKEKSHVHAISLGLHNYYNITKSSHKRHDTCRIKILLFLPYRIPFVFIVQKP